MQFIYKFLFGIILGFFAVSFSFAQPAPVVINKIIVFGDSLSDTGNDYQFSYGLRHLLKMMPSMKKEFPDGLIPSAYSMPYFHGRFSDGKNWFEDFANLFHLTDTGLHHHGDLENFAYGGAWAGSYTKDDNPGITIFPPDLKEQVGEFKLGHPLPFLNNKNVLVIIFMGANDYLAPAPAIINKEAVTKRVNSVVDAIRNEIKTLHAPSFKGSNVFHFIIMGMPDLALTPHAYDLRKEKDGKQKVEFLHDLSVENNEQVPKMIAKQLPSPLYDVTFIRWLGDHKTIIDNYKRYHFAYGQDAPCHDFFPYQRPIVIPKSKPLVAWDGNHAANKLSLLQTPVNWLLNLSSDQIKNPTHCDNGAPSWKHVYMDDVHPTRMAQCILALRACNSIRNKYEWQDSNGKAHRLDCGAGVAFHLWTKPVSLQQAADQCYKALQHHDLREDALLPFEAAG